MVGLCTPASRARKHVIIVFVSCRWPKQINSCLLNNIIVLSTRKTRSTYVELIFFNFTRIKKNTNNNCATVFELNSIVNFFYLIMQYDARTRLRVSKRVHPYTAR